MTEEYTSETQAVTEEQEVESNKSVESQAPETSAVVEEPAAEESAFLSGWQKRYQEHLAATKDVDKAEEKEKPKAHSSNKRKVLFHQLGKSSQRDTSVKESASVSVVNHAQFGKDVEKETAQLRAAKPPISRREWVKASPVFVAGLFLVLLAIYFISPASKEKEIMVTGNQSLSAESIIAAGQIPIEDYAVTTWLHSGHIARMIEAREDRIASVKVSFAFPNKITIAVTEHQVTAYIRQGDNVYPLLTNGTLSNQAVSTDQANQQSIVVTLQDQELVAKLMAQLAQVDSALVQNIQTIDLQPSKVTADLLLIKMYDGNSVLVPLSEIAKKLPYYAKIAPQLTATSLVDMEVGIFSYPQ